MSKLMLTPELKNAIADISEVSDYVWEKGWAVKNGGNISVDVTGMVNLNKGEMALFPKLPMKSPQPELEGRFFLIKITGMRFRDLCHQPEKCLLLIGIGANGEAYHYVWGGEGPQSKPTAEFVPHMKIHSYLRHNNKPQKAIMHTHPPNIIALTHMKDYGKESFNRFLYATHVGAKLFLPEGVGMVGFLKGGSDELADATVKLLKDHQVVFWEKHGCTTTGADLFEAFDNIDMMETAAKIFFTCKSVGFEPETLTAAQLEELKQSPL